MSRWAYSELTFSNSPTFTNHMELHQNWFSACQSAEGGNCPLNFPALPVDEFGVIRLNVNAITLKGLNMQIRSNLVPSLASFWHIWTGMKHWHCYWYPDDPDLISIQNLLELIDQLVWEFFLIRLKVIKLQLAQSNYACFSILGTKKNNRSVGWDMGEEQPFAEQQPKNHLWPILWLWPSVWTLACSLSCRDAVSMNDRMHPCSRKHTSL